MMFIYIWIFHNFPTIYSIPSVCLVFSECLSVCGELATGRFHVAAVERSLAASSELELPRHLGGFLSGGTPKLSLPTMAVIRPPNHPAVIRPWPLVLKPMVTTGETIFGKSENPKWQNWLSSAKWWFTDVEPGGWEHSWVTQSYTMLYTGVGFGSLLKRALVDCIEDWIRWNSQDLPTDTSTGTNGHPCLGGVN